MRVVVTGATGRLGAAMAQDLAASGHRVTALSRNALDISNPDSVHAVLRRLQPDAIINYRSESAAC